MSDAGEALRYLAARMKADSQRWFPLTHSTAAVVPLAAHYALGLVGEAGEVANVMKKALRTGRVNSPELAAELADVFTYLLLLANESGVDLLDAYEAKRRLNEARWGEES